MHADKSLVLRKIFAYKPMQLIIIFQSTRQLHHDDHTGAECLTVDMPVSLFK